MKPLLRWVLDSVLPPACLACTEPVEAVGQFCADCFRTANFITAPLCECCGTPLGFAPGEGTLCGRCQAARPAYTTARAAMRYDEIARRLILPLKYADQTEAASSLARLMRRPGEGLLQAANLLVPVPLHVARLKRRSYNQSALLAIALARLTGRPLALEGLRRGRATRALEGMGRQARLAELAGAIQHNPDVPVAAKRVLLIDDVMTSGATADECARALLRAGASRVDVLTVARVADPMLA